ncbi:uncharacterized protein LOC124289396 [Haliotis rubra]|uniref:uncharacterized protein LOC124289396 n=1 Tax=Haliotis rubra TaxID=36100 RepID=UPI001EE540CA|nr:uncharacterized protein LOC124289396 [Haliotis rubra]
MTEIFMTHLEEKALETYPITPLCWFRKVDDTFVILKPGSDPKALLDHINSQNPRIQVTMEEESNLKKGIISNLVHRAHNICSTKQHLTAELQHLKQVFTQYNNYPEQLVQQTIQNFNNKTERDPPVNNLHPLSSASPTTELSATRSRDSPKNRLTKMLFSKRSNTIPNIIKTTGKPPTSQKQHPQGTVYHVSCDCGQTYVGETSRPLKIQIKEHQTSVSKLDSKSALSDHIKDNPDHSIQWDRTKTPTTNLKDHKLRKLQEAIYIKRLQPSSYYTKVTTYLLHTTKDPHHR